MNFTMKKLVLSALMAALPCLGIAGTYSFNTSALDAGTGTGDSFDGISHGQAITWGLYGTTYGASYANLVNEVKASGNVITSATLTLTGIKDWTDEPKDVLYVDILNGLNNGLKSVTYNSNPSTYDTSYGANVFVNASGSNAYNNSAHSLGLAFTDVDAAGAGGTAKSLLKADIGTMPGLTTTQYNAMPGTWTDTAGPYGSGAAGSNVVIAFSADNLSVLEQYLEADPSTSSSPTVGLGFAAECHYYINNIQLSVTVGTASVPDSGTTFILLGLGLLSLAAVRRRQSA